MIHIKVILRLDEYLEHASVCIVTFQTPCMYEIVSIKTLFFEGPIKKNISTLVLELILSTNLIFI